MEVLNNLYRDKLYISFPSRFVFLSIIVYIIYSIYYRLTNRFWITQPVFHYHNLYNWILPKGIIHKQLIPANKNRYYEEFRIKTVTISPKDDSITDLLTDPEICDCFSLIQRQYLCEQDIKYTPDINDIYVYLKGHLHNSFISYFYETEFLKQDIYNLSIDKYDTNNGDKQNKNNTDTNIIIQRPIIKSVLIMRPLIVMLDNTNNTNNTFITNYVDFLCTGKKWRRTGITPKLINTTVYNTNKYNYDNINTSAICNNYNYFNNNENRENSQQIINTYFFKNEDIKTKIVPFIVFKSYFYDIKYWRERPQNKDKNTPEYINYNQQLKLSLITNDNINLFIRDFQTTIKGHFKHTITSSLNNIIELINGKQLFIFCMHLNDEIINWYFFKNSHIIYKKGQVWECTGSICGENDTTTQTKSSSEFINGFYKCILYLKRHNNLAYINIENVSNNNVIITQLIRDKQYISSTIYNYYFYNFIYRPQLSNETFILC